MVHGKHRVDSAPRRRRVRLALMPLTILSAYSGSTMAASVSVAGLEPASRPSAIVPAAPLHVSANYWRPTGSTSRASARARMHSLRTTGDSIPFTALMAYQRAETVIDGADPACRLPWQLIAAIGRVESDHGRYGGSVVGQDGVSRPGIYGLPLNGRRGTSKVPDTDAGRYDRSTSVDRAVGPLQFIPSTWTVVGVDADGDARRNPQDIDDAALAAAVYLCSGEGDLSTPAGRRVAVHRYNHSWSYVDTVLSIMKRYVDGGYLSGSGASWSTASVAATPTRSTPSPVSAVEHPGATTTSPAAEPTQSEPTPPPSAHPASPTQPQQPSQPVETLPPAGDPVATLLTLSQAILECTSRGLNPLLTPADWEDCLSALHGS
jgi:membrane-bound lytic murein transglycosylase B